MGLINPNRENVTRKCTESGLHEAAFKPEIISFHGQNKFFVCLLKSTVIQFTITAYFEEFCLLGYIAV
jgi:hypothetical protein